MRDPRPRSSQPLSPLVEEVLHDVAANWEAAVVKLLRAPLLGLDVSPPRERLLNELVGLLTAPALGLKERTCDFLLEFGDHAMLQPIGVGEAIGVKGFDEPVLAENCPRLLRHLHLYAVLLAMPFKVFSIHVRLIWGSFWYTQSTP